MTVGTSANQGVQAQLDTGYLESLFQGAGLAIVACNPEGRIVAWNTAAGRLFGESPACREGGEVAQLLPEADREQGEVQIQKCLTRLEPVEFRTRLGGTEADPIEYAVYVTPVVDSDETFRGVAVWFRDITARVRLQRALKKNERLTSLGSLAGGVAHHYNNLLCSIATSVEYAMNMNTMTAMRRSLRRASEAVARAAAITQQLLAFAQADHRTADMADLTETVLLYFDQHEARLAQHNIRLQLDWQKMASFPVRREQFTIILDNLVQNAIDAMPAGGVLSVTLARRDAGSVTLSISDSGGGISKEDMEHIFEPFHSSKADLGCGESGKAGLGLAVVHGLVHEMHGTISAANIPGHGARFDIVLPLESVTK